MLEPLDDPAGAAKPHSHELRRTPVASACARALAALSTSFSKTSAEGREEWSRPEKCRRSTCLLQTRTHWKCFKFIPTNAQPGTHEASRSYASQTYTASFPKLSARSQVLANAS